MMSECEKIIAELDWKTAENEAVEQTTDLFNTANPKEFDIPVIELVLRNAFGMGVMWADAKNKLREKEIEGKELNSGIWLAITEISFYNEKQLIEDIIKAVGFSYEECLELMEQSGCNDDILSPIVESLFFEEIDEEDDDDFSENEETDFYAE